MSDPEARTKVRAFYDCHKKEKKNALKNIVDTKGKIFSRFAQKGSSFRQIDARRPSGGPGPHPHRGPENPLNVCCPTTRVRCAGTKGSHESLDKYA